MEAEEQVLQEQQRRSAALPQGAGAMPANGDSISLSDGTSAAERDMVGHLWACTAFKMPVENKLRVQELVLCR